MPGGAPFLGGAFAPTPGYWWDAGQNVTQSSNLATGWTDRVAGVALSNGGGTQRPTYSASSSNLNGLPTLGNAVQATSLLQCSAAAFGVTTPFTVYALAYLINTGASAHYLFDAGAGATQTALYGAGSGYGYLYRNVTSVGGGAPVFNGAAHVLACVFEAGTNAAALYKDSATTALATGTLAASAFTMQGVTALNYLGGGGYGGGGELGHLMIVSGATSLSQRTDYMTYLATLGGVTLS